MMNYTFWKRNPINLLAPAGGADTSHLGYGESHKIDNAKRH